MPQIRRNADRRRRVLYQSHVAPQTPSTPAARLAAEQLREARQPADSFGSRVHRHLRGRWFSLVPVSRLAITTVVAVILLIPIGLTLLHHLAVTWPALAYRGSIARPLRVDQPDSFAAWWLTLVLAFSAGPVRLIYALRRHRRDDFRGHYQLWRFTLVVLLVASVHSTVGLVSWLGALMDLVIGDRAVLSGANWLRIVLDVGGIILAMRLIAEVHRCRPALIAMVAAATFLGISEAAAWRLIEVNSYAMSTLVLSAPLLGGSCLFAAATIYLRLLYRQVRNIAVEPTIGERLTQWWADRREMNAEPELKLADLDPRPVDAPAAATTRTRPPANERNDAASNRDQEQCEENSQSETDGQDVSEPKKAGFFSRFKRKPKSQSTSEPEPDAKPEPAKEDLANEDSPGTAKPKRRWLGLRGAKPVEPDDQESDASSTDSEPPARKKRRFSLRLKPQQNADDDQTTDAASKSPPSKRNAKAEDSDAADSNDQDAEQAAPRKKGLLSRLLGRKKNRDQDADDQQEPDSASSSAATTKPDATRSGGPLSSSARNRPNGPSSSPPPQSRETDDEIIDPDDIDWNSMSKAERRRMRKKLKRNGQAA